jgi:hypothetical protein
MIISAFAMRAAITASISDLKNFFIVPILFVKVVVAQNDESNILPQQ